MAPQTTGPRDRAGSAGPDAGGAAQARDARRETTHAARPRASRPLGIDLHPINATVGSSCLPRAKRVSALRRARTCAQNLQVSRPVDGVSTPRALLSKRAAWGLIGHDDVQPTDDAGCAAHEFHDCGLVPVETSSAVSAGLRTIALANCAAPSQSIDRSALGLRSAAACLIGPRSGRDAASGRADTKALAS
jgi:hypothetical protein